MVELQNNIQTYKAYKDSGVAWLGEIPEHWELKRLKYIFEILKRISGELGHNVLSITQSGIKVKDISSGAGQLSMDYSKYQLVYEGDFAMNHMDLLTGYVDLSKYDGVISPDYRVFILKENEYDKKYLLILLQLGYQRKVFYAHGQGVSMLGRWRFPADNFNNFIFPVPPLPEQTKIAQFLDDKTTKIDEAIAIKQQQIDLLKERKQILIHKAVTRGVTSSAVERSQIKLKDSGVEWIGEIPAHWEVKKVTHLFNKIGSGTTPTSGDNRYYDGKYNFLQTGDLNDGVVIKTKRTLKERAFKDFSSLKIYPKGSLVMAMYGATIGKLGILGMHSATNQACCIFGKPNDLIIKYFFQVLMAFRTEIISLGYGGGQPNISQDLIKSLRFPIAPLSEQKEIANYIETASQKIETAISLKQQEIRKLQEYKNSLINSVVTGKIKIV
jgi:type I restriction enzyme S subunit